MNQTVEYLKELTAIASPTGFTEEVSAYLVNLDRDGLQSDPYSQGWGNSCPQG